MTSTTLAPTLATPTLFQAGLRLWTVAEYHRMAELGLLTENDKIELLEGYLVHKMTIHPPHAGTVHRLGKVLLRHLPAVWDFRTQSPLTLSTSEPEPDLAIVVTDPDDYRTRHPSAAEIGLVIEVSDSSLDMDRDDKGRIYAREGIAVYWIVNLVDGWIEVYTVPTGPVNAPAYASRHDYHPGDDVPLVLAGVEIARLPVADIL